MNQGHQPHDEPLAPKEARQVAEEIRKRMLVKPGQTETLDDVAYSVGAPRAVAEEALRAVRERRARRPLVTLAVVVAVLVLLVVLVVFLSAVFTVRQVVPDAPSPAIPGSEATVASPGQPTDFPAPIPNSLGDWLVDAEVTAPRPESTSPPRDADEAARLLDEENEALEQTVLRNGGNFDHLSELRAGARRHGPETLAQKRAWNEVLRGNLRARGLLEPPSRG